MLALYPPPDLAAVLALSIPGATPPPKMHVTIAYTGPASGVRRRLLRRAAAAIAGQTPPFTATISGHARFTGTGEQDTDAIVALIDAPELEDLRQLAREELEALGIPLVRTHGYTPHMTLAWIPAGGTDPVGRLDGLQIPFTALTASHADTRKAFRLTAEPAAETARRAYLTGWTQSGAPAASPAASAGADAAATAARGHDPHQAAEATLHLGKLEGARQVWHERRENLLATHTQAIMDALRAATSHMNVKAMVERYRLLVLTPGRQTDPAQARMDAFQQTAALMGSIYARSAAYHDTVQAVETALAASMAEGQASVVMLAKAAAQAETTTGDPTWDAAYALFLDRLAGLPSLTESAREIVQQIVAAAARALAQLMARMAVDGETEDDMTAAVEAAVEADPGTVLGRAVIYLGDQAMTQAMSQAACALYSAEGLTEYHFLTAGDDRVCLTCDQAEQGSPYLIGEGPMPGLHGLCRCTTTPGRPLDYTAMIDRYFADAA